MPKHDSNIGKIIEVPYETILNDEIVKVKHVSFSSTSHANYRYISICEYISSTYYNLSFVVESPGPLLNIEDLSLIEKIIYKISK
jgi:hypothetical protein